MPESSTKQFSGIFVSYRRDDSSGHAGRLFDKLVTHFGKDRIFMDIDTIEPGEDFVTVIENAVGSCEVLIAIIGRNWLSGTSENPRALDNPNDFVRLEIATALSRDIRVIPVLVQRASMPKPQDLPNDLATFTRRNAVELTDPDWQNDVDQLIGFMERVLERRKESREEKHTAITTIPVSGRDAQLYDSHAMADVAKVTPLRKGRNKRTTLLVIIACIAVPAIVALIWRQTQEGEPRSTNRLTSIQQTGQTTGAPPTTAIPQPHPGMVHVQGEDSFMMGRDDGDENNVNERPAHPVTVGAFFIDEHEVTCDEYAEFIRTGHPAPPNWMNGKVPNGAGRKPVTNVKWDHAAAYCNKYGKRLPKEEEWELAARGTKGYIYPWGNQWEAGLANVQTNGLAEVGLFRGVSPYGAVDMVGNAWEWTASPLKPYPTGKLSEPPAGDWKVMRGGSYIDSPSQATTTYRVGYPARDAADYSKIGFRCVSEASKPQ